MEVHNRESNASRRSRLQLMASAVVGFTAVVLFDRASAGETPTSAPAQPDTLLAPAVVVAAGADSIDTNAVTRLTGIGENGTRSGTAFALADGRVATVAHALIDARTLRLGLGGPDLRLIAIDGPDTTVSVDAANDLAVIAGMASVDGLVASTAPVTAGDPVIVAGFGRDERLRVVAGAVVGRSPGGDYGVTQPDVYAITAPVNEGWSGGPVVNVAGQVVAVVVGRDITSGVTLAVPIEHLPGL